MEVLMAEAVPNEWGDKDPAGRGYSVRWTGGRGTSSWRDRSQSKEATAKKEMRGGAGIWGWMGGNRTSLGLGLSSDRSEPEMHPFLPLFQVAASFFQASSFKTSPLLSNKSNPLPSLIPLPHCPSHWSPSFLLQPPQVPPTSHPNQGQTLLPCLSDSRFIWTWFHPLIFFLEQFWPHYCSMFSFRSHILNGQRVLASSEVPLLSKSPPAKMPTLKT